MNTKKLNVKYDIGDVVWLLFDKKARQGVVYSVGIDYQSFASFCEKNIKDLGDKVSAADKEKVEADIKALQAVLDSGDVAAINAKCEALMQSSMKIGEALYKAQQAEAAAGAAGAQASGADASASTESKPDEGVVDADFEEVKKD